MIQLAPAMPAMNSANLIWTCVGDLTTQKIIVDVSIKNNNAVKVADWILCNSAHDFEPGAFTLAPKILPIGPLLAGSREGDSVGHFWPEDSNCLKWLDQQPLKSVIYVAFGSFTIFDKSQFQELALGLEISCRPFLWAVRPDITSDTNAYPEGFQERVATRGQMVEWAPQQKVLSHPSIACFLSHCGGIDVNRNEVGSSCEKIKNKVEQVLSDENITARAAEFKEKAMKSAREGGYSCKNFNNFIAWMKA
ncbi:hypothetical protein GH714_012486 [Hevea brasiliensis]|uniref:Anthocyanidin 3-O-glucosyltransferase n=1 Tax=Hevea brasiliensis TaxID=3981 RepID=A0A6A6MN62_HEVBR|nr:hypothetical protein GH714_012486 [Hevea brasiliensis]